MHHNLPLLINFTIALIAAFAGGYVARKLGLPALVGYLIAGLAIGPFTPGFVIGLALFQTALFVGLMLFVGARVMPWLLRRTAHTRSRELFLLAVVTLALGTALGAAELFGVSLALGAFLAGVVIGESEVSHQVGAEVLPFRDIFAVLFFVSVGMLVNPATLIGNAGQVLALTALVVVGKALITLLMGVALPASGRTMLVVAAGLSQIGEAEQVAAAAELIAPGRLSVPGRLELGVSA
jgi:predicted Kef-type K+ transport protein